MSIKAFPIPRIKPPQKKITLIFFLPFVKKVGVLLTFKCCANPKDVQQKHTIILQKLLRAKNSKRNMTTKLYRIQFSTDESCRKLLCGAKNKNELCLFGLHCAYFRSNRVYICAKATFPLELRCGFLHHAPDRAQELSIPAIRQLPPKTPPTAFRSRQGPISSSAKNRSWRNELSTLGVVDHQQTTCLPACIRYADAGG